MEGMVSSKMITIQREYFDMKGTGWRLDKWASGLVVRLLEITHGQWLYRNVAVHDSVVGRLSLNRQADIAMQIEQQLSLGGEDLLEEDQYLMDINWDTLQGKSQDGQEYWLLAIQAARVAGQITREIHPVDGEDYG